MERTRTRRLRRAALLAALAVSVAATVGGIGVRAAAASPAPGSASPVVRTDDGLVRGATTAGVSSFLGLPYAASPTGNLRWRPPQPAAAWSGVRDGTQFGPSCPQVTDPKQNPFLPPGPISEDCLYLNVYAPAAHLGGNRPVLVWIHGGGLVQDGARDYDGSQLAADGTVVVTINYRLGALGFLAHPALATRPGGSAGNYGLMDQQAALRWVQRNIAQFGGDPRNVTIGGESAGGLSVLAQMVSPSARGLFQRAIVQSGTFALTQQPLATAEAAGQTFATSVGCASQTAQCLRSLPASSLVSPLVVEIPGVVDGSVLPQSIGTALAHGQFARVPLINGITHNEELLFVDLVGLTVSQGTDIPLAGKPTDPANYQANIAMALGVSTTRAAAIAAEYPLSAYPSPDLALSTLVSDASFACSALQVDRGPPDASRRTRTSSTTTMPRWASRRPGPCPRRRTAPSCSTCSPCRTCRSRRTLTADQQALAPACGRTGPASPRPATRRRGPCPGRRSVTARTCCRWCPRPRRSRRTSPPHTTARSGPPVRRGQTERT